MRFITAGTSSNTTNSTGVNSKKNQSRAQAQGERQYAGAERALGISPRGVPPFNFRNPKKIFVIPAEHKEPLSYSAPLVPYPAG